jgi:hypothetical protein
MNHWTDRETEEMVALNAGVRLLCGLEQSSDTTDHTSIETFRSQLGPAGSEEINQIIVQVAQADGFTDAKLCSSDTTVQEAPIAYPTEVGHMKNIADKLVGIGAKIGTGISKKLKSLAEQARNAFREIRLFTRGKKEQAIARKKKLGHKLQQTVAKMERMLRAELAKLSEKAQAKYRPAMELYRKMLSQIREWQRTGFHPKGKIISLWLTDARAITRLTKGYIIGTVCKRLGSGSDSILMPEVLSHFERTMGEDPNLAVFDRGGDGTKNHRILEDKGIRNAIFRKGKISQPGLGRNMAAKARRERALSEATIATIKHPRYGFTKPRARSSESCVLKGQMAIMGANLAHLTRDWVAAMS